MNRFIEYNNKEFIDDIPMQHNQVQPIYKNLIDQKGKGLDMYLCVLSSIPDANDVPYDPSAHMNGFKWKHHPMHHKGVEKQIRGRASGSTSGDVSIIFKLSRSHWISAPVMAMEPSRQ